jgi:L-iditol 2-dehydrogenase
MQAVTIREDGEPALEELPVPSAGPGEIGLALLASGLCGTDLFKLANRSASPGTVLGHEIVGRVVEVGAGVDGFRAGDRVVVPHHLACGRCRLCLAGAETQCAGFRANRLRPGGFSERIVVDAAATSAAARLVPDSVATDDALFLEPGACVLRAIDRSGVAAASRAAGEATAVVFGGGSMGLLHLLTLRAAVPTCAVHVVDPRTDRRELALELGAASALAPGDPAIAALQADAAFDCVGGAALASAALAALRPGGSAVLFAHARPGEAPTFELNELFKHEKRLLGAYSGSLREQERVFEMLASGALRPGVLVTHRLPLAEFARGVELARRQEALKVVFEPGFACSAHDRRMTGA